MMAPPSHIHIRFAEAQSPYVHGQFCREPDRKEYSLDYPVKMLQVSLWANVVFKTK